MLYNKKYTEGECALCAVYCNLHNGSQYFTDIKRFLRVIQNNCLTLIFL